MKRSCAKIRRAGLPRDFRSVRENGGPHNTLRNSRTFPGQEYSQSFSSTCARSEALVFAAPDSGAPSGTISSRRSRRGGTRIGICESRWNRVGAEAALLNGLLQILIGGRHQAHVHQYFLHAADAVITGSVQHAEQFHLHARIQVADLIEKERAFVRDFETGPAWLSRRR